MHIPRLTDDAFPIPIMDYSELNLDTIKQGSDTPGFHPDEEDLENDYEITDEVHHESVHVGTGLPRPRGNRRRRIRLHGKRRRLRLDGVITSGQIGSSEQVSAHSDLLTCARHDAFA